MCEHYKKYILEKDFKYCPECGKEIVLDMKDQLKKTFTNIKYGVKNMVFYGEFLNKIKELEENKQFIQNKETYIIEIMEFYTNINENLNIHEYTIKNIEIMTKDEYADKINKKYLKYFDEWCEKSYNGGFDIRIKNKLYFISGSEIFFKESILSELSQLGPINKNDVLDMLIEYNGLEIIE